MKYDSHTINTMEYLWVYLAASFDLTCVWVNLCVSTGVYHSGTRLQAEGESRQPSPAAEWWGWDCRSSRGWFAQTGSDWSCDPEPPVAGRPSGPCPAHPAVAILQSTPLHRSLLSLGFSDYTPTWWKRSRYTSLLPHLISGLWKITV